MSVPKMKVTPVKPYCRFPKTMAAGTGLNPMGSYLHFIGRDPAVNFDVHRDRKKLETIPVTIPIG